MSKATEIPDQETLSKASELTVYNSKGEEVKFGSLFEHSKTVVVFIRHFFCGSCNAYVGKLAEIPQSAFDAANTKLVVIGCGDWAPISAYAGTHFKHGPSKFLNDLTESANFSGVIYADPSRELYHTLGMTMETLARTPTGQTKRSYLTTSMFSNVIQSIWRGPLKHPNLIGKQGNISQLGGDFILGPGRSCSFASRMQHTEDRMYDIGAACKS
ncbi:hypothetical protein AX15_007396 [Amanita polypyramis BW_CC]|nr:hypothetical protein AX15_007396 [Amanita polypyramis BW_CC]